MLGLLNYAKNYCWHKRQKSRHLLLVGFLVVLIVYQSRGENRNARKKSRQVIERRISNHLRFRSTYEFQFFACAGCSS